METSKVTEGLERTLEHEVETIVDAVQRVRDLADGADGETERSLRDVARDLRNASELVRCLRSLVAGRTLQEIHSAFGAPGDWGYGTPAGFDLEPPVPAPRGERWMVRGDDGRSAAPAWEVERGEGYHAADHAAEGMRLRLAGRVGARVEIHIEKGCGHLHLRVLLVLGHDGLWEPFLSPLSAPPHSLPLLAFAVRELLGAHADPGLTSRGGDA